MKGRLAVAGPGRNWDHARTMSKVTINGITFDTTDFPSDDRIDPSLTPAAPSKYLLIATTKPLDAAAKETLAGTGATILEAVPGGAIVCRYPAPDIARIRSLPFIAWADRYPKVVKLSPALLRLPARPGGVPAKVAWNARPAMMDPEPVLVDVMLHREEDAAAVAQQIAEAAHVAVSALKIFAGRIRLTLKRRRLLDVASIGAVRHIDLAYPAKLANSVARTVIRAPAVPSPGNVLTGNGEVICIADTGFDTGSATNVHPAFTGRVKKLYAITRPGLTDDPDGHGTHVAGSALGDGNSASEGPVQGTAPGAHLVLQSLLDESFPIDPPASLIALFDTPYQNDQARIHSNSWVLGGGPGVYESRAQDVDTFVYEHRDMLICFAAGNEGQDSGQKGQIDLGSICPPGTAKNCLTIGASENDRKTIVDTWDDHCRGCYGAPIATDPTADEPEGMTPTSSRGPTGADRIKPDLVAPGSHILSTRSRKTSSKGWGLSSDPLYMFDGGTSMATPLVAGAAAVVRQFLRETHGLPTPSAALVKALLINGARALKGQYVPTEAGRIPNNVQGFGLVDLQAVIGPYETGESLQFFDENTALVTGDREDRVVQIPSTKRCLKVTLVWTDPPGEGLQSDLDLIVSVGRKARHGNQAASSTAFDRVNNVEQVTWPNIPQGAAKISVVAHSVLQDPQSYALVIRLI